MIEVGKAYEFYSSLEGVDGNGLSLREFSGESVTVKKEVTEGVDPEIGKMYEVVNSQGIVFQAFEEELDGSLYESGMYYS